MMVFYILPNTMQTLFPLRLYTTSCCHLCEEAYALLCQLELTDQLTLLDIVDDDALLLQYGTRIPVLQKAGAFTELSWPFTKEDIIAFLNG